MRNGFQEDIICTACGGVGQFRQRTEEGCKIRLHSADAQTDRLVAAAATAVPPPPQTDLNCKVVNLLSPPRLARMAKPTQPSKPPRPLPSLHSPTRDGDNDTATAIPRFSRSDSSRRMPNFARRHVPNYLCLSMKGTNLNKL